MKKILLIILLLLIFFVTSMAGAVKYQVSCDLVFDDPNALCMAWDYLDSKRSLGFSKDIKDAGDKIEPSRKSIDLLTRQSVDLLEAEDLFSLPEIIEKRPHRLKVKLRLDSREERDKIWYYLLGQKPFVASKTPGRIEKHTCGHDENPHKPCVDQQIEAWCQEVVEF